ncbi:MAG: hypothetical protein IPG50_39380 [Myxococcales bacterium]|nr:hypothetical protein [Myxococcales bacterium]
MERGRDYLEFYRLDVSRASRRVLIPATALVAFGSLFVCVAAARIPISAPRGTVGLVGAVTVLFGLVLGFGGMARLLAYDGFIGFTRDGVHVRDGRRDEFVAWGDIESVTARALVAKGGTVPLPSVSAPAGVDLTNRIDALRRRALHGLLP